MKILVTGAAGFIGYHVCKALIARGDEVVGIDNLNNYYDVKLKIRRPMELNALGACGGIKGSFVFREMDISLNVDVATLFLAEEFDRVIHLAAQAGVRYSIENPYAYVQSNLVGFTNILEACRHNKVKHLVYASSSSVYGDNKGVYFDEDDSTDSPLSFYAATKKANEVMAHSYSHLYGMSITGLRFFTVYGPWGRPDMMLFKFTKAILAGEPIDLYNDGQMWRDFTYVDDLVSGILRASDNPSGHSIYNLSGGDSVRLDEVVRILQRCLGKKAIINSLPMQAGDVARTEADISLAQTVLGYEPKTRIRKGIQKFVDWYVDYYRIELKDGSHGRIEKAEGQSQGQGVAS